MLLVPVRHMNGGDHATTVKLPSKLSLISDFRKRISKSISIPEELIRLFFAGKQLEDKHTIHEYNISHYSTVLLMISKSTPEESVGCSSGEGELSDSQDSEPPTSGYQSGDQRPDSSLSGQNSENNLFEPAVSIYYRTGELVDAQDVESCIWSEAKIVSIKKAKEDVTKDEQLDARATTSPSKVGCALRFSHELSDDLVYFVKFDDESQDSVPTELSIKNIRPRSRTCVAFDDITLGNTYMVNYNIDKPSALGYWFDCKITGKKSSRRPVLEGLISLSPTEDPLKCTITQTQQVFVIEKVIRIKGRDLSQQKLMKFGSSIKRLIKPNCDYCKDAPQAKCTRCSCFFCGGKEHPENQMLCDECNNAFHTTCLDPPLDKVPEDDWYCPSCRNDQSEVVRAGEKLKPSKKRDNAPSAKSTKDWGRGMACAGVTKKCTIVPPNHFGPIPGVEVGMSWLHRTQVSETGIHRPPVGGIHAREGVGAFSIVLSGGYEDDVDDGDEFLYTGSGGRDLSSNKRTNVQSSDQLLEKTNKGLALNCHGKLNPAGGGAQDWQKGKPVRVVRGFKNKSEYSPSEGYRYDGLYKVVKYWPEKGKSGFIVWRYQLKRDDPTPAPWSQEGQKRILEMGFELQRPIGIELKDKNGLKRKADSDSGGEPALKKVKPPPFILPKEISDLIAKDVKNKKLWDETIAILTDGKLAFLEKIQEVFICIVCQDLVAFPLTTDCLHNICKLCLQRSFKANVHTCPVCRTELEETYEKDFNKSLHSILTSLFLGYNVGR